MPQILPPLPARVNFIISDTASWGDVFRRLDDPPSVDDIAPRFCTDPSPTWVLQTWIHLMRRGLDVRLSPTLVPGEICVVNIWKLPLRQLVGNSYCVVVQADCCQPAVADEVIVQNPTNVSSDRHHLINHWPQPGLIPRDPNRGSRVENLVFRGTKSNLWRPLQEESFRRRMASLGVRFEFDPKASKEELVTTWPDYQEADVVIAMRNLTQYEAGIKPATKLTNAWLAGCPAILGPEPAYQALKTDDADYLEVLSVEQIEAAVRRLKEQPQFYDSMVTRARKRAVDYTIDAISRAWRDTLAGPVYNGYCAWKKTPRMMRHCVSLVRHPGNVLRHRRALKRYRADRHQSPRLMPGAFP